MKCPNCYDELLKTTEIDENIIPYRQSNLAFPISIMVIITETYKCNCGTIVKKPTIEHYEYINKKSQKEE